MREWKDGAPELQPRSPNVSVEPYDGAKTPLRAQPWLKLQYIRKGYVRAVIIYWIQPPLTLYQKLSTPSRAEQMSTL